MIWCSLNLLLRIFSLLADHTRPETSSFQWTGFGEGYIARLLQRMGLETEETARTGDGGVDIVARSGAPITGGVFSSPVGEPVVRDLYGALNQMDEPG